MFKGIVSGWLFFIICFFCINANATTIGFEGFSLGYQTGIFTEAGYQMDLNDIFIGTGGNPGNEAELGAGNDNSTFFLSASDGSLFNFISIDLEEEGNEDVAVSIIGTLDGNLVAQDFYYVFSDSGYSTFSSLGLAGLGIDTLQIIAPRQNFGTNALSAFDNIVLEAAPVPEPSTFLLLGGGLVGLAFAVRRRRKE